MGTGSAEDLHKIKKFCPYPQKRLDNRRTTTYNGASNTTFELPPHYYWRPRANFQRLTVKYLFLFNLICTFEQLRCRTTTGAPAPKSPRGQALADANHSHLGDVFHVEHFLAQMRMVLIWRWRLKASVPPVVNRRAPDRQICDDRIGNVEGG